MVTIDSGIVLDFPPTWERLTEGRRCVFHTPKREEVIVSAERLTGEGAASERALWLDGMVEAALEAAGRGAASPELRIIRPLAEDTEACTLRCWTVIAETPARDAVFAQAVLRHERGTLFVTYESPFVDGAEQAFRDLLRSIHES
jgi:hypothetical protein